MVTKTRSAKNGERKARQALVGEYFDADPRSWTYLHFLEFAGKYDTGRANKKALWLQELRRIEKTATVASRRRQAVHLLTQERKKKIATTRSSRILASEPNIDGDANLLCDSTLDVHPQSSATTGEPQTIPDQPEVECESEVEEDLNEDSEFPLAVWKEESPDAFTALLDEQIIDLRYLQKIDEGYYETLRDKMLKLPANNEDLAFVISRFDSCSDWDSLIRVTETCPRRNPDESPLDAAYIFTYANRTISHWITNCRRYPRIVSHMREGNYDVMWASIIDHLWEDPSSKAMLLRKDLRSHAGKKSRFDGVFRYYDGAQVFDVGVTEASLPTLSPHNNTKGINDLLKIHLAMISMLRDLRARVDKRPDLVAKLQVFGIVTCGLTLRIYRMQWDDSGYCVVKESECFVISFEFSGISVLFSLLNVLVKVKAAMDDVVELVKRGSRELESF